jgi:RimJ/RimL family protein N-acetyltransferase
MFTDILYEERIFSIYKLPRVDSRTPSPIGDRESPDFFIESIGLDKIQDLSHCRSQGKYERDAEIFTDRMLSGSICFILRNEERIAGFGWANAGFNPIEDKDRYRMNLGGDGAYLWDFFISPAYRGRSLYQFFLKGTQSRLADMGLHRCFIKLDSRNDRIIQQHKKLGATLVETVLYRRRFWLTTCKIETSSGAISIPTPYRTRHVIERDFSAK